MVTVTRSFAPEEPTELPALYEHLHPNGESYIVLFVTERAGMLVSSNDHDRTVGEYNANFSIPCTERKFWTRLPSGESITITQD